MSKAELMTIIGRNVKNARLRCGITQEQLAEIADIGASFIAQIESGKKMMSIPVLVKIAEALNVSCDYLLHSSNSSLQLKNIEEQEIHAMANIVSSGIQKVLNKINIYV